MDIWIRLTYTKKGTVPLQLAKIHSIFLLYQLDWDRITIDVVGVVSLQGHSEQPEFPSNSGLATHYNTDSQDKCFWNKHDYLPDCREETRVRVKCKPQVPIVDNPQGWKYLGILAIRNCSVVKPSLRREHRRWSIRIIQGLDWEQGDISEGRLWMVWGRYWRTEESG